MSLFSSNACKVRDSVSEKPSAVDLYFLAKQMLLLFLPLRGRAG
jgi:hypothetical protein